MSFLMIKAVKFGFKQVQKRRHPDQHNVWYENDMTEKTIFTPDGAGTADAPAYGRGGGRISNNQRGRRRRQQQQYPPQPPKFYINLTLRLFQFAMGLTIVGLYGIDLHHATEKGVYADPKWVYAEWTSCVSAITAGVHLFSLWYLERRKGPSAAITSYVKMHLPFFVWEVILCIFWLVLFGIFGKMYISEDAEGQSGIKRMKRAVWVDFMNLLLWATTATGCGLRWWRALTSRDAQTQAGEDTLDVRGGAGDGENHWDAESQRSGPRRAHYQGNAIQPVDVEEPV
ncbi:hypothetical protein UA08_03834 [Talaromyces atroroseus]|uniref:MARVEL domain-containing protein n=1 Tax=Talaromyces atroroseus TaxID=1441469 RepID=A0A225AUP5_TALAT|nr:hypothetical protein UA08_03834 [Talaromyces atroroseus]OKL61028.1 hypothetical protein UA08_03834 [Talaromyces atroroseus]